MAEKCEVITVGAAAGGPLDHTPGRFGTVAPSARSGRLLSREKDDWDPDAVFVDGNYLSHGTWYDSDRNKSQPQVHYYYVGGATKLYGARQANEP